MIFLSMGLGAHASYASSGTEGASFLDIPVGARPAALGSAYTALATDAYAPTWNPAGLGVVTDNSLAAQYLSYIESLNYESFSYVHPLGAGQALGLGVQYLGTGDIARTDINPDGSFNSSVTGTYGAHYGAYSLAYGRSFGDRLSLGLSGKWINAQIDDVSANAYAMDVGGLYRAGDPLTLAATVTNIGTKLTFLNEGDSLPLAFHLGGAYHLFHGNFLLEGVYPQTGLASLHTGFEWLPLPQIALRTGYKTDTIKGLSPLAGFSLGVGLKFWGQEFSYAWLPMGDLGSAQYISLLILFGAPAENKRNLIRYGDIRKQRSAQPDQGSDESDQQQLMELLQYDEIHTANPDVNAPSAGQ